MRNKLSAKYILHLQINRMVKFVRLIFWWTGLECRTLLGLTLHGTLTLPLSYMTGLMTGYMIWHYSSEK